MGRPKDAEILRMVFNFHQIKEAAAKAERALIIGCDVETADIAATTIVEEIKRFTKLSDKIMSRADHLKP